MNVLITGATGFVGKYISYHLNCSGFNITTFSRKPFFGPPSIVSIHGDSVYSLNDLGSALRDVDCVIHLEGRAHIMNKTPAHQCLASYRDVNVDRTLQLASAAADYGVKKFVFVSTIKVHGEYSTIDKPFASADLTLSPLDPYSISKLEAEVELKKLSLEKKLNVLIVRPPLIYGPGAKGNLYQLLRLISSGIPLPFASLTTNHRSLLSLHNFSCFLQVLLRSNLANEVLLVSDGRNISTSRLVKTLVQHLQSQTILFPFPPSLLRVVLYSLRKESLYERLCGSLVIDPSSTFAKLKWRPPDDTFAGLYHMAHDFMIRVNS